MLGERGGGFLFDTNAIHKGEIEGTEDRTLLVLEFNPEPKAAKLRAIDQGPPIPFKSNTTDVVSAAELRALRLKLEEQAVAAY